MFCLLHAGLDVIWFATHGGTAHGLRNGTATSKRMTNMVMSSLAPTSASTASCFRKSFENCAPGLPVYLSLLYNHIFPASRKTAPYNGPEICGLNSVFISRVISPV